MAWAVVWYVGLVILFRDHVNIMHNRFWRKVVGAAYGVYIIHPLFIVLFAKALMPFQSNSYVINALAIGPMVVVAIAAKQSPGVDWVLWEAGCSLNLHCQEAFPGSCVSVYGDDRSLAHPQTMNTAPKHLFLLFNIYHVVVYSVGGCVVACLHVRRLRMRTHPSQPRCMLGSGYPGALHLLRE
eukprot:GHUV01009018.1.p1 GENE.GHUV01009018.1~~GHUV01009018.1.p1  ORF type:complete len:183 (+),score=18.88 GHUV01009018.1:306-854(+)